MFPHLNDSVSENRCVGDDDNGNDDDDNEYKDDTDLCLTNPLLSISRLLVGNSMMIAAELSVSVYKCVSVSVQVCVSKCAAKLSVQVSVCTQVCNRVVCACTRVQVCSRVCSRDVFLKRSNCSWKRCRGAQRCIFLVCTATIEQFENNPLFRVH